MANPPNPAQLKDNNTHLSKPEQLTPAFVVTIVLG
jgi:hypothetical protein